MGEPALRLCADAGLSFEATDRALLVPCANAPVDLLLVRAGDVPEYVQDGVVDLGITGANLVVEAAADVDTLAELGFARCTLQAAVPDDAPQAELRDLDGLRVATAYPASTLRLPGGARRRGRADPSLRIGRGGAEARALRRDRRPRLHRLHRERERAAPDRDAARVTGGPDRRQERPAGAARARRAARADALRRRRRAQAAVSDAERPGRLRSRRSRR